MRTLSFAVSTAFALMPFAVGRAQTLAGAIDMHAIVIKNHYEHPVRLLRLTP